jgi:protein-L-isoaspartate(D-aspartate) O-methyltransferase
MMLMRGPVAASNQAMVQDLEDAGTLTTPECVAAFRAIDRQHFWVPGGGDLAYADMPLRHGRLHQSAPHIYARALESLMPLKPGMSFLNVGSGTGYFSSVVSELCGPDAISDGLDIWPELVAHARECCRQVGKDHINFTLGNVYQLDVEQGMRYDRIYLGACANAKSKYLYRLLEVGGVLVGPFQAGHMQQLRRVVRRTEAHFAVEVLNSVQFATLVEPVPAPLPTPASRGQEIAVEDVRSLGLKGVPFTFALRERPWAPQRNLAYPASFREAAYVLLSGRPRDPFVPWLPSEIWADHVLPWCSRMWFEVSLPVPTPIPSKMRIALSFVGEAVRKGFFRKRLRSDSSVSDAGSDGGSTRASSEDGSPMRFSRAGSTTSFGSASSEVSPTELTLYEALGNGRSHAIGSSSDPDEMGHDDRSGLLVSLLENNLNAANIIEAEDEPAEEPPPMRIIWRLSPLRAIRRCIGWCRLVVPRRQRRLVPLSRA